MSGEPVRGVHRYSISAKCIVILNYPSFLHLICCWFNDCLFYHKAKYLAAFGFSGLLTATALEFAVELTMLICSLIQYFVVSSALSEALIYFVPIRVFSLFYPIMPLFFVLKQHPAE